MSPKSVGSEQIPESGGTESRVMEAIGEFIERQSVEGVRRKGLRRKGVRRKGFRRKGMRWKRVHRKEVS